MGILGQLTHCFNLSCSIQVVLMYLRAEIAGTHDIITGRWNLSFTLTEHGYVLISEP